MTTHRERINPLETGYIRDNFHTAMCSRLSNYQLWRLNIWLLDILIWEVFQNCWCKILTLYIHLIVITLSKLSNGHHDHFSENISAVLEYWFDSNIKHYINIVDCNYIIINNLKAFSSQILETLLWMFHSN